MLLENLWTYCKVWSCDALESDGFPDKAYFERRAAGWRKQSADKHALRYPNLSRSSSNLVKNTHGRNRSTPLQVLWCSRMLGITEARRTVYCPIYERLVRQTEAWRELEHIADRGDFILLQDHDAYARGTRSWEACLADETKSFGHAMILACMLENQRPFPWEKPAAAATAAVDLITPSSSLDLSGSQQPTKT